MMSVKPADLVGRVFKCINFCDYEVREYLASKDWYKCRYKAPDNKYYYCYLTKKELFDKTYFEEVVSLPKGGFIKGGIVPGNPPGDKTPMVMSTDPRDNLIQNTPYGGLSNPEINELISDDLNDCNEELKCWCGIDASGVGGNHSDYCPKYEKGE